jgi:hypothetical protein
MHFTENVPKKQIYIISVCLCVRFQNALNIYTRETVRDNMLTLDKFKSDKGPFGKRTILVFHCEFSSERGPAL